MKWSEHVYVILNLMNNRKESKIDKIQESLYSKTERLKRRDYTSDFSIPSSSEPSAVSENWKKENSPKKPVKVSPKTDSNFTKWLLISSLTFFVLASILAFWVFFSDPNTVSQENILISSTLPRVTGSGEEVSFQVILTNDNPDRLDDAELVVEFPQGTTSDQISLQGRPPRYEEFLGTVQPGQTISKRLQANFFGKERSEHDVVINLRYRLGGSANIITKREIKRITLGSAPLKLEIDAPSELAPNANLNLTLTLVTQVDISDLILEANYPFGFFILNTVPQATVENNIWKFSNLRAEQEIKIVLNGRMEASKGETKSIGFSAGLPDDSGLAIKSVLASNTHELSVRHDDEGLGVLVSGDSSGQVAVSPLGNSFVDITWTNTEGSKLTDGQIEVKLSGSGFDKNQVSASRNGFYRSSTGTIFWDQTNFSALASIPAGASDSVNFRFGPSDNLASLNNPEMTVEITFRADSPNGPVVRTAVRTIRFSTSLGIQADLLHFAGPFQNVGPLPPRADQPTTYTVRWDLSSSTSNVEEAVVEARLPNYVSFTGEKTPGENITYNQSTRIVRWEAGQVTGGAGLSAPSRQVFFQISFLPSTAQVGQQPVLVQGVQVLGYDIFTGKAVSGSAQALSTVFSGDPDYRSEYRRVVD